MTSESGVDAGLPQAMCIVISIISFGCSCTNNSIAVSDINVRAFPFLLCVHQHLDRIVHCVLARPAAVHARLDPLHRSTIDVATSQCVLASALRLRRETTHVIELTHIVVVVVHSPYVHS